MAGSGDQELSVVEKEEREVEGKSEEEVYTLLFREVDSERAGAVSVASLVDYLHQIQLGTRHTHTRAVEEVYDSHEDVGCPTISYSSLL